MLSYIYFETCNKSLNVTAIVEITITLKLPVCTHCGTYKIHYFYFHVYAVLAFRHKHRLISQMNNLNNMLPNIST